MVAMEESTRRRDVSLTVLAVIGVGFTMYLLRQVLLPLALAFFLSYLAMPVVRLGKRLHVPVVLSMVTALVLLAGFLGGMGLVLYTSGAEFAEEVPDLVRQGRPVAREVFTVLGIPEEDIDRILPPVEQERTRPPGGGEQSDGNAGGAGTSDLDSIQWAKLIRNSSVVRFAKQGVGSLLGLMGNIILVLLFLVFIIMDRGHELLDRRIVAAFSRPGTENARPVLEEIHRDIENYILTKTGISLLTGLVAFGVLTVFEVPHALLFGLITFFLNYIPNVGSIVATIPPALVAWIQTGSLVQALPVAACLAVTQFVIGNVVEPVVFGRRLRLNPMMVLIWLVFWGWLWGIWGMVLAVPLAASTRIVLERTQRGRAIETLMRSE